MDQLNLQTYSLNDSGLLKEKISELQEKLNKCLLELPQHTEL